uniref:COP9 signalosome complex subunit 9 n=1 Tax=Chrysemys picta bellii TaxID=8478 RepID=A0A8C3I2M8_CHRPI
MKPAVDEMFPEGAGPYVDLDEAGGSTGLLMDLAANEKAVHADFFNGKAIQHISVPVLLYFYILVFLYLVINSLVGLQYLVLEINNQNH